MEECMNYCKKYMSEFDTKAYIILFSWMQFKNDFEAFYQFNRLILVN